jgi:hypothetical protein
MATTVPVDDLPSRIRAALSLRDEVDHLGGAATYRVDALFSRFGFVPTCFEEQQRIENALLAVGLTVQVDPADRGAVCLARNFAAASSSLEPTPVIRRACGSCGEPAQSADLFCGACGLALSLT